MARHVNLDALVPREDFETTDKSQSVGQKKNTLAVSDLRIGDFFLSALRKPDFQRETSEWDAAKVIDFVESFLNRDLIPAVILWQSAGSATFVIDGAHRISSLVAWINDDYGDGDLSTKFYDGMIPDEQIAIAVRTRNQINKKLGSYKSHQLALTNPEKVHPDIVQRAKNLATVAIAVQWIEGNASSAEASFFKINQKASPIDPTELKILQKRRTPVGIAARAIVRSGRGHKYWSKFSDENQRDLERLASDVNRLLFHPSLPEGPVKTLELPVGGTANAAQALPLVLEFIELVNASGREDLYAGDEDGGPTIKCIERCKKVVERMDSGERESLGLHPIVYFYSINGRHKIASFLAVTALVLELERTNAFKKFTAVRGEFENLLIQYDYLIQQIVRQRRGATASVPLIKDFYITCIDLLSKGKSASEVADIIVADKRFGNLILAPDPEQTTAIEFSRSTKSTAFIKQALPSAMRCPICNGYLYRNAMSVDHKTAIEDGGSGAIENSQITHPYCNTGYKESVRAGSNR